MRSGSTTCKGREKRLANLVEVTVITETRCSSSGPFNSALLLDSSSPVDPPLSRDSSVSIDSPLALNSDDSTSHVPSFDGNESDELFDANSLHENTIDRNQ